MLRHLDRARDFRPAEVLVDGEEPVGALEAGAHRIDDGVHYVLTAGKVRLEKNKIIQKLLKNFLFIQYTFTTFQIFG